MIDPARLEACYATTREHLLAERNEHGHWEGELSTSALATAVAVMALELVRRSASGMKIGGRWSNAGDQQPDCYAVRSGPESADNARGQGDSTPTGLSSSPATPDSRSSTLDPLISRGLAWLAAHQNPDGGWGDTVKNTSNISTSMLARAVFRATGTVKEYAEVVYPAIGYCDRIGGVEAVKKRYGKDHTFSVPILTHCALAGLVEWRDIPRLPFEMACLPARFYKTVRLPIVSYALPALIAIGQVRHHHHKPWNPITRTLRWLARDRSLKVLERIQPTNGGFLEATPLTSFVTMSLAGMGLADHPVARKGVEFIVNSVRPDGSWPIDTNLATWVTTLSINALGDDLPPDARPPLRDWLLGQQYREVHPYTNADPGGWAWTDLPGGVPDADDTPGAMLALCELSRDEGRETRNEQPDCHAVRSGSESPEVAATPSDATPTGPRGGPAVDEFSHPAYWDTASRGDDGIDEALANSASWLVSLQNRDGGFPTFCRGWGTLPFDRSSADITAHCLRALIEICGGEAFHYNNLYGDAMAIFDWSLPIKYCTLSETENRGFRYLEHTQQPDGSWYPLWFGNQFDSEEENPTYGTAKVLAAYRDWHWIETEPAQRGLEWLKANQNPDGGWGGRLGLSSSVEETALATELLVSVDPECDQAKRGVLWLLDRVDPQPDCHADRPDSEAPNDLEFENGCTPTGLRGSPATLDPQHSPLNPTYTPQYWTEATPIGFYFAKLWYFERLYPIVFTVGALRRAVAAYVTREA